MRKKASVVIATTIAVFILSMITLIMLREQPWPHDVAWPTQRLTRAKAEELSDVLASLENELEINLSNREVSSIDIINTRFKPPLDKRYEYMLKFLGVAAKRGTINGQFLYGLTKLAYTIDDLSENGDILITGMIDGGDFVIILESVRNGEVRRVIM